MTSTRSISTDASEQPEPAGEKGTNSDASQSTKSATICQVVHSLNVGGTEILAARMAWNMSDRYRFVFACLDELGPLGEHLQQDGYRVEVLDRRPGLDFRCARRLRAFIQSEQVDLVHAHQYTPFSYAMLSGLMRRRPPVLFTEHGRWFPDYPRKKRIVFNRLCMRRTDRAVAVGQAVRQAVINNEGIPSGRVGVIYNGVNLRPYEQEAGDRAALRREMGVADDDFVIIMVARLDHLKDHATAVRTLERVVVRCPRSRLVLVGEGPELEMIRRETISRNMENSIRLLGLRDDVPNLLRAADAFLLTSVSEGIPLTLIEAMAAGLPIVSTDVGGVSEVVTEGETGLLAPSGDDAALADAMCQVIEDASLREVMSEAGKKRAWQMFSEPKMHAGYTNVYKEMLGG